MIQRSPSEYYLKYLLSHPDGYDNEHVAGIAFELDLDWLGDWYLDRLRSRLKVPKPFYPDNPVHILSQGFLIREKLRKVFVPDQHMRAATYILEKPKLRELVEVMMLSGAPHGAIAYGLKAKHQFDCDVEAINHFKHYYWNIDLLGTTETRAIVRRRLDELLSSKDVSIRSIGVAMAKTRYSDPRMVAAHLPSSPLTALMSQVQMGVYPKELKLAEILEQTRMMASLRAFEAVAGGGPANADMAAKFILTAESSGRMLDTVVKPEDQLREDLQTFKMRTSERKVPLLTELTGGHHTIDVQPEPEAEPSEVYYDDDDEEGEPE